MNVLSLRAYLQPSATLRWHPAAPIIAAVVFIALIFASGADLGFEIAKRQARFAQYLPAIQEAMIYDEQATRSTAGVIRRAAIIDHAVRNWVEQESDPDWLSRFADSVERKAPRHTLTQHEIVQASIVKVADVRLAHLAGDAPAWQETAAYCRDFGRPGLDVASRYESAAVAYTRLLGREVSASQLAPAVPGGKC